MDTQTGVIHYLDTLEDEKAKKLWQAYMSGALTEMPKLMPIDDDKIPITPKKVKDKKRKQKRCRSLFANG